MKVTSTFKRAVMFVASASMVASALSPLGAQAVGNINSRSVSVSNPTVGATTVTYTYTFTPGTNQIVKGVQFLACTTAYPLSSCTAPTGLSFTGAAAPTTNTGTGFVGTWLKDGTSTVNDLRYTQSGNATATNATAVTFAMGGITNETGTVNIPPVYIRVFTYDNATVAGWNAVGTGTGLIDTSNVVMQPVQAVTVTGIVQEQLTFCVYDTAGACATGMTAPVAMGILSSAALTTPATNKFDIKTNANSGATIQYVATTFTGPSQNIPAGAGVAHAAVTPAAGTESFGMTLSAASGGVTASYGLGTYTIQTNGSPDSIATVASTQNGTGTLAYTANINAATKPGQYTSTFTYQALATF